jgi:hypothetical protein
VLVQCRTLSRLDLARNALGDQGAGRLGCVLQQVLSLLALLVLRQVLSLLALLLGCVLRQVLS